jgi:hypothetical protein
MPRHAAREVLVVLRVHVPDVRTHCEIDCAGIQLFRSSRSPDSTRVFETGVFGNRVLLPLRTCWKELTDPSGECLYVLSIESLTPLSSARALDASRVCIGKAFLLGSRDGLFVDEQPLTLISFARAAEADDDGSKRRVTARPPR